MTYPGYPLVADASAWGGWFYLGLPILILIFWWRCHRPARTNFDKEKHDPHQVFVPAHARDKPICAQPALAAREVKFDFSTEKVGAEPTALFPRLATGLSARKAITSC
jgi:hypothetical protein